MHAYSPPKRSQSNVSFSSAAGPASVVEDTKDKDELPPKQDHTKLPPSIHREGIILQHLKTLEHLDKQHQYLCLVENSLARHLNDLEKEEQSLREAFLQSSSTLKEQRHTEMRQKEKEALARLEEALMNDNEDDDDSEGTS